jgi:hypothetical protein
MTVRRKLGRLEARIGQGEPLCACEFRQFNVGERIVREDGSSDEPVRCAECGRRRPERLYSDWDTWQALLTDLARRARSYEIYTRTNPPHTYAKWTGMLDEEQDALAELVAWAAQAVAEGSDDPDLLDVVRVGGCILDTLPVIDLDDLTMPTWAREVMETPTWSIWVTHKTVFDYDWRQPTIAVGTIDDEGIEYR